MKTFSSFAFDIAAVSVPALLATTVALPAQAEPPATIPQHYSHIRIALEQYSTAPMSAFEDQLLQTSVDLVNPDDSLVARIHQVAPNTPQLLYGNVSSIYQNLLSSWLNYADAYGVSREGAFYHANAPLAFSGASPSATPVNWF